MRPAVSLSRPIVVAFAVFGLVLSAFFAVLATLAVEGIEGYLVDNRLSAVQEWAAPREAAGLGEDLPAGLRFHRGEDIPLSLRGLSNGVSDVELDGIGLHVLSGSDERGPYVVVDHESDYEKVELVVYSMFAAFFVGFVVLAVGLGSFIGQRIVTPIRELASAVESGAFPLPLTERRDELGILARTLEGYTFELREFLNRERLFTGDVSHELRTPLSVIMGAAEILLANNACAEWRAPAQRIHRAANEATECINVLLLLARAPNVQLFAPVSVNDIARRETERYQQMVVNKPIVLRFVELEALSARAPAELCASAVSNLIRNACQYTEQGAVTVTVGSRAVVVEDTGHGLPKEVFEIFQSRGIGMPSSGSAGTGLGLSLAKRICDYLGATLHYERCRGGGSRFTIEFPNLLT